MPDRKQLSDVFARSPELFHQKVPFREAFPQILNFRLEVSRQNSYNYEWSTAVYTIANPPGEYIDCTNSICCKGGFSVGDIFREMVREGKTEYEGTAYCRGYEGSPKGRARYRSCIKTFGVKLTIEYEIKQAPEESLHESTTA